ncbi:MAG TPA: amylo-alpha-1,6-glucosidase [Gemmatimonadales bacterium]|jgi:predicted glycogen debranching enzyme
MDSPIRRISRPESGWQWDELLSREWLVSNGLGGYSSGTLAGVNTRSYHGLLVSAQPAPLGRLLMLKQVVETLSFADGSNVVLAEETAAVESQVVHAAGHLAEFRLEAGQPVWVFETERCAVEKRILMPQRQNTAFVLYRLLHAAEPVHLTLRPWIQFRTHDNPVRPEPASAYRLIVLGSRYEIDAGTDFPTLRLLVSSHESRFIVDGGSAKDVFLRLEADRGYQAHSQLWSPGAFSIDLPVGGEVALVASSEEWNAVTALQPGEALAFETERSRRLIEISDTRVRESPIAELVLAADQFLITPVGRLRDAVRAQAAGDQVRSVIAGYHWFADWGRDTMISLEGLTLVTGRPIEAAWILRTFHHYIRDGLIPNFFPEGREEGLYHTADATLWFFHALQRYVDSTQDRSTLKLLLPALRGVIDQHIKGTRYGIGVDPADGLLKQGADGYQLTWMDAKVDGWVVTPRRGKAVEINALWFNALEVMAGWEDEEGGTGAPALREWSARAKESFNRRFWFEEGGYLYDVIDGEHGDDPACRPNQLLAISLPNPVLGKERWEAVIECVKARLLTPVGLRSLAPGHPSYKAHYFGDLRARDAAYHQGTVWAWLIGPFIDAWLALHPEDRAGARKFLEGFLPHLNEAGIGTISEIFDAEEPYTPRGCIAQAWSVAEVLRCWVKTAPEGEHPAPPVSSPSPGS